MKATLNPKLILRTTHLKTGVLGIMAEGSMRLRLQKPS